MTRLKLNRSQAPGRPLAGTASLLAAAAFLLAGLGSPSAQDDPAVRPQAAQSDEDLARQLANPIANLIQVPFQHNLDYGGGRGRNDAFRYVLNIQPVIPFTLNTEWNLITRTIIPIAHLERVFPQHENGLGDVAQTFFLSPSRVNPSGIIWGAGPVFLYPTATNDFLGTQQFSAGPSAVLLQQNGGWLYGALANHVWSLSDAPTDRSRVNTTFIQPVVSYTFPTQTTVFVSSESTYNWTDKQWTVPINLGITQLLSIDGQKVQVGGIVRRWVETPTGGPDWGFQLRLVYVFPR